LGVIISGAAEGLLDAAVLRRLIEDNGGVLKEVYGKKGKDHLKNRLNGYNNAANWFPWVVLMDLDHDADCPPALKKKLLPNPSPNMCFRLAVRAIEAWLIADNKSLAGFLGIASSKIPLEPELLEDPKKTMVELAKLSRRRNIREGMVPRQGSGRKVGSDYTFRLIEFVYNYWKPEIAIGKSDSLRRCCQGIRNLVRS